MSAIGTARWSGARLADVIADSLGYTFEGLYAVLQQIDAEEKAGGKGSRAAKFVPSHVHFTAADGLNASIPIKKALDYCEILL